MDIDNLRISLNNSEKVTKFNSNFYGVRNNYDVLPEKYSIIRFEKQLFELGYESSFLNIAYVKDILGDIPEFQIFEYLKILNVEFNLAGDFIKNDTKEI